MSASEPRIATISIAKEYLKFSAAHFTIFSRHERERLHGHNFTVAAEITASVDANGMTSNYRVYKDVLKSCCDFLDEYVLLPGNSPFLEITQQGEQYQVQFADQTLHFLCSDTKVLPITNTTVEEFSNYILSQLLGDKRLAASSDIQKLAVTVASGPGQTGTTVWHR
ncbi:6-pyruvoyl trahydropterin synthase family protein [Halioxenophilus sp. WMMB6]|uniref:6-pyruvoyl trahydropterin synthase family protein n=1 Tax=Halioxenophilus sp. WMMB6 TaxID=3073815 RepID=UPI00295F3C24|nr:6-carboxytetrahydropterin synthase [Halioxenophilus sp. WMMB6]